MPFCQKKLCHSNNERAQKWDEPKDKMWGSGKRASVDHLISLEDEISDAQFKSKDAYMVRILSPIVWWQCFSFMYALLREGFKKKIGKSMVFCQTPLGPPPPVWSFFRRKKLTPNFFFRNKTLIGWNKFYTWSHLKIYYFLLL